MSKKTFIEVWHEDEDVKYNLSATRSLMTWKDGGEPLDVSSWKVNGSDLQIYDVEEVKALRKLLDAIEEVIKEESN